MVVVRGGGGGGGEIATYAFTNESLFALSLINTYM